MLIRNENLENSLRMHLVQYFRLFLVQTSKMQTRIRGIHLPWSLFKKGGAQSKQIPGGSLWCK